MYGTGYMPVPWFFHTDPLTHTHFAKVGCRTACHCQGSAAISSPQSPAHPEPVAGCANLRTNPWRNPKLKSSCPSRLSCLSR